MPPRIQNIDIDIDPIIHNKIFESYKTDITRISENFDSRINELYAIIEQNNLNLFVIIDRIFRDTRYANIPKIGKIIVLLKHADIYTPTIYVADFYYRRFYHIQAQQDIAIQYRDKCSNDRLNRFKNDINRAIINITNRNIINNINNIKNLDELTLNNILDIINKLSECKKEIVEPRFGCFNTDIRNIKRSRIINIVDIEEVVRMKKDMFYKINKLFL
jgi:hypothetical protein